MEHRVAHIMDSSELNIHTTIGLGRERGDKPARDIAIPPIHVLT